METMSSYPITPQTQMSHMRHSTATRPTNPAQQATRSMQAAETTHHSQQPLSAPASQESFTSAQSNGSSVRSPLQSSSSNLSQLTNYTDPTSPVVAAPKQHYEQGAYITSTAARRAITPEQGGIEQARNDPYLFGSPMSVASPALTNGAAKRTASGHVKNAPSVPTTPMAGTFAGRTSRRESISSTGSRAGELAATLKTRLGYAMAKVQQGWEHKTIAEVEQLAAHKMSPNRHSMSHVDYSRRPTSSGLSNGTARMSMYETYGPPQLDGTTSPPSKRRSGTYSSFMASPQQPRSMMHNAPLLQPPADIRPGLSMHSYYSAPSSQFTNHSSAMSPPRTPISHNARRPATIRTDTQTAEAERDALQALFQLGSPHASQVSRHNNASQASSIHGSPLRGSDVPTPRRVTFARSDSEGSSIRDSSGDSLPGA